MTASRRPALIQSVERACDILWALAGSGGEASLKDISLRVGLSKSTVHGLLATLQHRGLVGQAPSGHYTLGMGLMELGSAAVGRLDLRSQATDLMRGLVDRFGETSHLVTRDGMDIIYIDKVEGTQSIRITTQVGSRLPAFCTGVGKAILAFLPHGQLADLLACAELKPYTRNTITDKERLIAHLDEVCRRGYALDDEEITEGLRCVAAPIFDHTGSCIGGLSVSGPSIRMGPARIEEMIPAVTAAAREVSRRLGYRGAASGVS